MPLISNSRRRSPWPGAALGWLLVLGWLGVGEPAAVGAGSGGGRDASGALFAQTGPIRGGPGPEQLGGTSKASPAAAPVAAPLPLPEEPLEDGADSSKAPIYRLAVRMAVDRGANRGAARGTMRIRGWAGGTDHRRCLYLPYNDTDYEFDPIRDFDLTPRKYAKPMRRRGSQTVNVRTPGVKGVALSPQVLELVGDPGAEVLVEFESWLPRWPDADPDEWVFTDFHPQPLVRCPKAPGDSRTFTFVPHAHMRATLAVGDGWQVASPGLGVGALPSGGAYDLLFDGRKLVIGLLHGFLHRALPTPGIGIEVFYRDPGFEKLVPTLQNAILVHTDMFGPPPFPHEVILETSDVEKSSLPGVIAVNRPRQAGMSEIQSEVLNWTDWQVTAFVAEQWFGASVTVPSLDDLWLLRGFVDFATIEALANLPQRYKLFRDDGTAAGKSAINFDYRQGQDLLAAVLTYLHPYNALTDARYENLESFAKQHSLSYVRHALALRQMNWTLGRPEFRAALRRFFATSRGRAVRPKDFAAFIEQAAPAARAFIDQWWTTSEWPDFELLGVDDNDTTDGKAHEVTVTLAEHDGFSLPVTVTATDDNGKQYVASAHPIPGDADRWLATLRLSAAVDTVEIDADHQIFDWNRFDNTNTWPSLQFLPGNAHTFADDAYTVIWLPLATQLPGEPLTLELVAQGFRYMHSSTTAIGTYQPSTHAVGYSVYYLTDYPKLGSYLVADAIQDKGLAFEGERVQEVGLYRTIASIKDPYVEVGLRLRNREEMVGADTRHQTLALKGQATPLNQYGDCNYSAKFEIEQTVHAEQVAYNYNRRFLLGDGSCKLARFLEVGLRAFGGELTRADPGVFDGGNFRFHPQDTTEARMRIDEPVLDRVDRIATFGADILVPAPLPIPDDIYILKRETRYRLFYDFGESQSPDMIYKDAGVGLWVPIGADLVGKGSVSLLNFSFLVVLYREAGAYRSSAPGILFDFDFFGKI